MAFVGALIVVLIVMAVLNHVAAEASDRAPADGSRLYAYRTTVQGPLQLEVFNPPDWHTSDRRPAIVFFFGGGWTHGTRQQFAPQARHFASRGMVAITADYRIRGIHGTTPADAVDDARAALRWICAYYRELGIDPQRLVAGGGSAGGHLAAAAALCPEPPAEGPADRPPCRPAALVLFNPVLDLADMSQLFPGSMQEKQEAARQVSPVLFVGADAPPAILFYGTDDRFLAHGRRYVDAALAAGARAELFTAAGQIHAFFNRPPWFEATLLKADDFLVSLGYLKPRSDVPGAVSVTLNVHRPATAASARTL